MNIDNVINKLIGQMDLSNFELARLTRAKLIADMTEKNIPGYLRMLGGLKDDEMLAEIYKRFNAQELQKLILILALTGMLDLSDEPETEETEEPSDDEKTDDDKEKPKQAKGNNGRRKGGSPRAKKLTGSDNPY